MYQHFLSESRQKIECPGRTDSKLEKGCMLQDALLMWMLDSQASNNKSRGLHEHYLRIIYNDQNSNFGEILRTSETSNHFNL